MYGTTVDLVSTGAIASDSNGVIVANTLTGSSIGNTTLNAINRLNNLGAFTTGNGNLSLTDNEALTVLQSSAGVNAGTATITLSTPRSGITLDGPLTAATVDLVAWGGITDDANGIIAANTLTGSSVGFATLNNAPNVIADLGAFTVLQYNVGEFYLEDAASLTVTGAVGINNGYGDTILLETIGSGHGIAIDAALTVPMNLSVQGGGSTINVISAGTISQSNAGIITTPLLEGSSAGAVSLNADNQISWLPNFATNNSNFSLADAQSIVEGNNYPALNAGSGTVTLTTAGSAGMTLSGVVTAQTVNLNSGGNLIFENAPKSGYNVSANTLNIDTGGSVTEDMDGAISAGLLNVSANTGITLLDTDTNWTTNDITTIGTDKTNSGPNTIDQH